MFALGSSTISWTGLGVLGMGAGIFVAGAGASDMNQGAEEFFLGMSGDSTTPTRNGMSDLFYGGNDSIYHLSTGTAAMAGSMLTPYVNGVYGKAGVTAAGSTAGNGRTAGTTATESGAGNAQAAETTVTESMSGNMQAGRTVSAGSSAERITITEAAGGTVDDALEQLEPVRKPAIGGAGGIEGGTGAEDIIQYEKLKSQYAASEIVNAERVGSGLKTDPYHRAASFISEEQLARGRTFTFTNGDGRKMTMLQTEGELNGVAGIYEYILNPQGQVEHQLFKPGAGIIGAR